MCRWLHSNSLSGTIPTSIGSLTGLTALCALKSLARVVADLTRLLDVQVPLFQQSPRLNSDVRRLFDGAARSVRSYESLARVVADLTRLLDVQAP